MESTVTPIQFIPYKLYVKLTLVKACIFLEFQRHLFFNPRKGNHPRIFGDFCKLKEIVWMNIEYGAIKGHPVDLFRLRVNLIMQMPTKNINPLNDYERGRKHGQWNEWKNLRFHPRMKNVPENHFPRTPYSFITKFNYGENPSNREPPVTLSIDKQMLWSVEYCLE